jgi:hypothetical protein
MMRSAHSPDHFQLAFDLQPGWSLRSDPDGGASVVNLQGTEEASVLAPMAIDAADKPVPTTLKVLSGNRLGVNVTTTGGSYPYPIMVDPTVIGDFFNSTSDPTEQWWINPSFWYSYATSDFTADNKNGSYEEWYANTTKLNNGDAAYYYHNEPSQSWAFGLQLFDIYNNVATTSSGGTSGEMVGINDTNVNAGIWTDSNNANASNYSTWRTGSGAFWTTQETDLGTQTFCVESDCGSTTPYPGDAVGLPGPMVNQTGTYNVAPSVASDGVSLFETDDVTPTVQITSHTVAPGTWINPKTQPSNATDNVTSTLTDTGGLGLSSASLSGPGLTTQTVSAGCKGGHTSPCPPSKNEPFSYSLTTLPEGIDTITAAATSITGYTGQATWTDQIDETPPTAAVSCAGNGAWTSAASESCTITGSDPNNASNGTAGSGLATLTYETNTNAQGWSSPITVTSGASITVSNEGQTQVQAIATDNAGNTYTSPAAEVNIDQTEPDISISGSLVSNKTTLQAGAYSLAIGVQDPTTTDSGATVSASSGVQSTSIAIDGTSVGTYQNSNCSTSGCPSTQTVNYSYSVTPGEHEIVITSTDEAGNASTYTYDFSGPVETTPEPTKNYNLLTDAGLRLDGTTAGDLAGSSVADIGDINGDGIEDYAIGAPHYNNGAGAVFVIYGQTEPATVNLADLTPTQGFQIDGAVSASGDQPGDLAGMSVAAAGDVNGDGYGDFLIGAPRALVSSQLANPGSVYVVFGGPNLTGFNLANIATAGPNGTAGGFQIQGPPASLITGGLDARPFGYALAGGGAGATETGADINGDGLDDIVLGESDYNNGYTSYGNGAAWVIFGKTTGTTVSVSSLGSQGFEVLGPTAGANLGASVSMAGDQNGDGNADFAVAAPGVNCDNRLGAGAVFVIYGTASTNQISLPSSGGIPSSEGYEICGNTGDRLGSSTNGHGLADIGDVSTDGIDDLAIGGDGGYVVFGQSSTNPIDLANVQTDEYGYRINAPSSGGYTTGSDVFAVGDLNNDGTNDLAITDPTANDDAGDAFIVYGKPDDAPISLSSLSAVGASSGGEFGFHVPGPTAGDELGTSAIGLTDATGSGDDDLLLGAPGASNDGASSGSIYLVDVAGSNANPQASNSPAGQASFAPRGYGLVFQGNCAWNDAPPHCLDPAAKTATNWTGAFNAEGKLAKARSMQVMKLRLLVNWGG